MPSSSTVIAVSLVVAPRATPSILGGRINGIIYPLNHKFKIKPVEGSPLPVADVVQAYVNAVSNSIPSVKSLSIAPSLLPEPAGTSNDNFGVVEPTVTPLVDVLNNWR
jgi:hypothetical protein